MYYDPDLEKLKLAEREAEKEAAEARAKLASAMKAARAASDKVAKAQDSRSASAYALYAQHEDAGYNGTHASPLFYLRSLDLDRYAATLRPFANAKPGRALIEVEHEAVTANFEEWTRKGQKIYHEKEVRAYEMDCESFERWQAENSDHKGWRDLPATRRQYFLMWRTGMVRDIDYPKMTKRGEAHDWLKENGANIRLRKGAFLNTPSAGENSDD